ncbi:carbamoyl-phosphate synthase, large subunit [Plasmodium falciparum Vietnam Oak-Knoll (FVO)]|uniref:carbamoyl-phosphate synthase (ammonia) n=1 Tax=Plasmodium falciparum Vietnam Oak-Knoll (FVO) TaxID=1036723 RepID=A0A024V4F9_PLAFA|nr:carbamoyl-phosphate synthase, large subunit [Plasmodium falciparum Vietnam Oak-Knoll (FVO)]
MFYEYEYYKLKHFKTVGRLILEDGNEFVGYSVGYEGCKGNNSISCHKEYRNIINNDNSKNSNNSFCNNEENNLKDDLLYKNSRLENEDFIVTGEVIFNTAMVGYPEALTDPSYFGQILVLTFPSIGNYGIEKVKHDETFGLVQNFESNKIQVQGLVICEYSKQSYHYNSYITLSEWLKIYKIPCIGGIDTRALTKLLREKGSMLGKIVIYKNRQHINKLYKEINLFDPGNIDTLKYVCNHFIRVIKLNNITYNYKNKEEFNYTNEMITNDSSMEDHDNEINGSISNFNNCPSISSFDKSESKNVINHTLLRDKMNLITSSEEYLKDLHNCNFSNSSDKNDSFFKLYGICEYDKYLIDLEENASFHYNNVDEYGYYDVNKNTNILSNNKIEQNNNNENNKNNKNNNNNEVDYIKKDEDNNVNSKVFYSQYNNNAQNNEHTEFNLNNDYSTYIRKKMKNEEFLNLVNKRKVDHKEKIIVIVDCGIKNSIIKNLIRHGMDLPLTYIIVPYYYNFNHIDYDAVLLSNGPGDPKKCDFLIRNLKDSLTKNKIIFGICLGNQLLGISLGCDTYKMKYGNRGVNQPVIQLVDNICYITSQNHGYCLKKKSILKRKELAISYINANDKSIEGISHKNGRFYSVQFHPEGNNGPEDTSFLFKNFLLDIFNKKKQYREYLGYNIIYIKKKVLLLGSGGLCIGQAGEFDYSGTQAIKSLKECGIYVILVNPNIATVQTSKGLADKVYFLPVNCEFVEKIIKKEKPDFILCTFGGQTALNCALMLDQKKVLKKNNCQCLGTSLESIRITENRTLFAEKLKEINERIAPYGSAKNVNQAIDIANKIGYPILVRTTFSLGGLNSSFINNEEELIEKCNKIFLQTDNEIFIDKSLQGWKEIEYELLRDNKNNCIAICNMENIDPLGIHTGDSIVVAPSQTLSNYEYYKFREIALKVITHLNIIGECNIQFGINPQTGEYCIIEVNARLSRSSALASKATGYPLAYISAKIALGYDLISLKNSITKKTTACFEPSLDYITTKIPRWDLNKFEFASNTMNSSMKSVGEVMSIGRTFEESIQKSLRCIDDNYLGFSNTYCIDWDEKKIIEELKNPSPKRIDAIHQAFHLNMPMDKIHELTHIDYWFLHKFYNIYNLQNKLKTLKLEQLSFNDLKYFKKHGFSDKQIAHYLSFNTSDNNNNNNNISSCRVTENDVMKYREKLGLFPHIKVIDTLSAEFPALTNYLYLTYQGQEHDVLPLNMKRKKICTLNNKRNANKKKVHVKNHLYNELVDDKDTQLHKENNNNNNMNSGNVENKCKLNKESYGYNNSSNCINTNNINIENNICHDISINKNIKVTINNSNNSISNNENVETNLNCVSERAGSHHIYGKEEKSIGSDDTNILSAQNSNNNFSCNNENMNKANVDVNVLENDTKKREDINTTTVFMEGQNSVINNKNKENSSLLKGDEEDIVMVNLKKENNYNSVINNVDCRKKDMDGKNINDECKTYKKNKYKDMGLNNNIVDELSNGTSHSTNDHLYLDNFNTSDEEIGNNKNMDMYLSKQKSISNKNPGNSYYVVDSVYNNEYKINKMKELIDNENLNDEYNNNVNMNCSNYNNASAFVNGKDRNDNLENDCIEKNMDHTYKHYNRLNNRRSTNERMMLMVNNEKESNHEKGHRRNGLNKKNKEKNMEKNKGNNKDKKNYHYVNHKRNNEYNSNNIESKFNNYVDDINKKEYYEDENDIYYFTHSSQGNNDDLSNDNYLSSEELNTDEYDDDYYYDEDEEDDYDDDNDDDDDDDDGEDEEDNDYYNDDGYDSYNSLSSSRISDVSSVIYSGNENIFNEKYNDIGFKIIDNRNEKEKEKKKCFIVLGCGCYRIGSSVEFDWSAIHCVKTIRKLNHKAILINCNPETVSTDYDESDRLYFDEITTEVIKFIYNFENSNGVIIAFGGQTSNNLVFSLYKNNVNILGSSAQSVDCCENRNKFSHLCDSLKIDQPKWNKFTKLSKAIQFANEVKFPVLVRPSYVLSGAAMRVVNCFEELKNFLMKAAIVSKDNPVVISKFIENAKEIEIDCVSKNGKIINYAISEHVENAGVHSGDATLILPAQNIYVETHRKIKKISEKISKSLNISGPFNIQFICHQNEIKIIECNLRASRTFPFISKALNLNFIDLATRILMGYDVKPINISLIDLEYTAVKAPIFSFNRLHGSDCILGVEMKSTGEVACFGLNKYEALLKSLIATGMKLPKKSILISIKNLNNKLAFEEPFQLLFLMGFTIYATEGTYDFYSKFLESFNVNKGSKFHQRLIKVHNKNAENISPNTTDLIMNHKVEMVINITDTLKTKVSSNGYKIRRLASDFQVPLITNMKLCSLFIDSLYRKFSRQKERKSFYTIKSYDEYISLV